MGLRKKNGTQSSNSPEIRFDGFVHEWEIKEFSVIAERLNKASDVDNLPRVEYEDIVSGEGVLNKDIYQKVSSKKGIYFKDEDVLFGKLRPYLKNWLLADFEGIAVGDFWVLRGDETNGEFLYSLIQTDSFDKAANLSSGSKMPRSDWGLVSSTEFGFPLTKKEQTKIGDYFQQLDTLIAQHQQKQDKLLQLKKSLLEKMFPKQGQAEPEIRFKGSSGKWQEKELGLEVKITMGQSPNGVNYTANPEDHILVQGNADIKNGFVVPRIWTTQITKAADAGDLIFSVRAPVGDVGKTKYDIVIGRGVAAIKGNEFIFQFLKRMNENGEWAKLTAGSTFDSINSTDLSRVIVLVAESEEQIKIGVLLKSLDTLINQHQTQLTKLNNIKQACLEKMFV